MADRISIQLRDPVTDLALPGVAIGPAGLRFLDYRLAEAPFTQRTPPLITEIGDGDYGFTPTDEDEAAGVVFLIIAPTAEPQYHSGAIHTPANPFIGWHLEDNAGALWAGAAPTVASWRDFTGAARTPPAVLAPTSYLFVAKPSAEDLLVDVAFRIDSPAGAEPPDVHGSLERQTYVAPPSSRATLGETVRTVLMGDAAVVALIGTRLYPNKLPQGAAMPAAVYNVISSVPENSFTGQVATTLKSSRVQIDCYARADAKGGGYAQAHAVAKRIGEVLGDVAEADVAGVLELERDTFDDVTQFHGVSMDFTIWT